MTLLKTALKRFVVDQMPPYTKHLKLSAGITLLSLMSACSATISKPDIILPTNSSAYNRPILAGEMTSAANQYIEQKFACKEWSLVDVKKSVATGQLVFTSDGQLFKGEIAETWGVNFCGEALTLLLRAEPTPEGNSLIKIRTLSE